jgi:flavodoxin
MSDTIVVYVTRNGHSRDLALDLGKRLGAEVLEIGDLVNRKGLFGWLKSGRQAAMGAAAPIRDPGVELGKYKTVILVQPVWASAVCPPIRTWIRAHAKELGGKRIAVLASAYGSLDDAIRAKFETEFAAALGPLAACAVVRRKDEASVRERVLADFAAELTRV